MKNFITKLFVMTIAICLTGIIFPATTSNAYAENHPIYEKYQQGGVKCAEKEYNKLIKKNPKDEVLYANMVYMYRQEKQYDKALNICNIGIKAVPNSYILYNLLGTTQKYLGNTDAAIKAYTKSIEIEPSEPPYFNRARLYVGQGKFEQAISDYSMAIKYSETNPDAYKERAVAKLSNAITTQNMSIELSKSIQRDLDIALKQYRQTNNVKGYQEVLGIIEDINSIFKRNK